MPIAIHVGHSNTRAAKETITISCHMSFVPKNVSSIESRMMMVRNKTKNDFSYFLSISESHLLYETDVVTSPPIISPCVLPKSIGNCGGHYVKFYFDQNSKRCEQFVFTGE